MTSRARGRQCGALRSAGDEVSPAAEKEDVVPICSLQALLDMNNSEMEPPSPNCQKAENCTLWAALCSTAQRICVASALTPQKNESSGPPLHVAAWNR